MKTNQHQEEQQEMNEEMLAAVAKLTLAGFLLLIVLIVLFWQNYTLIFKKDVPAKALSSIDYILPITLSETAQKGKTIFIANCAACHNKNMRDDLTGPALGGVKEKWAAYPRQDLYKWIRNSQAMIQQKHPRALALWKDWNPTIMNSFNSLKDDDIDAIFAYVEEVYAAR
ncbi:MAG TPA: cytochrome c [Haliscomenobacter sp.]|nr:cytochrome c [Haliscomenobacter sp.]